MIVFLEWSLKSLFHRPLTSACPLAFSSTVTVETNSIDVRTFLYSYHIYSVCIACGTPSNMRTLSQPTIIQHSNRPAVQMPRPPTKFLKEKPVLVACKLQSFSLDDFHVIPVTAAGSASVSVPDPLSDWDSGGGWSQERPSCV